MISENAWNVLMRKEVVYTSYIPLHLFKVRCESVMYKYNYLWFPFLSGNYCIITTDMLIVLCVLLKVSLNYLDFELIIPCYVSMNE